MWVSTKELRGRWGSEKKICLRSFAVLYRTLGKASEKVVRVHA